MVVLGHETTIGATMDDMLRHTQAVVRGTKHALIVADLPFMSYQVSAEEALRNAGLIGFLKSWPNVTAKPLRRVEGLRANEWHLPRCVARLWPAITRRHAAS